MINIKYFVVILGFDLFANLCLAYSRCELTDYENRFGFCSLDQFCCKGFAVNNLCPNGAVCCYGSYDCSSDSSNIYLY